nr:hypothetical protein [Tanacetum cinerariifolium]
MLDSQVNDKKIGVGYHAVPPPYTGNFMPHKPDLTLANVDEYIVSESVTSVPAVATNEAKTSESKPKSISEPLIEDCVTNSEDDNETRAKSKQRKPSFAKEECVKPNEQVKYPRESVKQNSSKAVVSVNTARQINTAYPRPTVNSARPVSNVFNRAHSHDRRPFNKFIANKDNNFNKKVNNVRGNITTVGPRVVVSDDQENQVNVVKASACWVWRPKHKVLDHVSRNEGASITLKKFDYGNPQLELQEKKVIDSRCSKHMTANKSYLSEYEEIDGGYVAFGGDSKGGKITGKGKISTDTKCVVLSHDFKLVDESQVLLRVPRKNNMYSVDLKNVSPSRGEEEKKDAEDLGNKDNKVLSTKEPRFNQEKEANVNNTNNINTVSSTVNTASI